MLPFFSDGAAKEGVGREGPLFFLPKREKLKAIRARKRPCIPFLFSPEVKEVVETIRVMHDPSPSPPPFG